LFRLDYYWYAGQSLGRSGLVPAAYLEVLSSSKVKIAEPHHFGDIPAPEMKPICLLIEYGSVKNRSGPASDHSSGSLLIKTF
jgi:hypothetical protein